MSQQLSIKDYYYYDWMRCHSCITNPELCCMLNHLKLHPSNKGLYRPAPPGLNSSNLKFNVINEICCMTELPITLAESTTANEHD